jgi:hypothetical protein
LRFLSRPMARPPASTGTVKVWSASLSAWCALDLKRQSPAAVASAQHYGSITCGKEKFASKKMRAQR